MSSSTALNLAAIDKAIAQHNANCPGPASAIYMAPFEVERLDFDVIKGLPIRPDEKMETGRFRVVCDLRDAGGGKEIAEEVEAPSPAERELVPVGAPPGEFEHYS